MYAYVHARQRLRGVIAPAGDAAAVRSLAKAEAAMVAAMAETATAAAAAAAAASSATYERGSQYLKVARPDGVDEGCFDRVHFFTVSPADGRQPSANGPVSGMPFCGGSTTNLDWPAGPPPFATNPAAVGVSPKT